MLLDLKNQQLILDMTKMPPPDVTDPDGTQWWLDKSASDYASRPDARGITFDGKVWINVSPQGFACYVLAENQHALYTHVFLEEIAKEIDKIKFKKFYGNH